MSLKVHENDPAKVIDTILSSNKQILDRTDVNVFTIDGKGTQDFDDALSLYRIDETSQRISIYITNVSVWMDALHLWESFANRIATIYLPDRRRPMLPTILSNNLCSLQQGQRRIAFVMDVNVNQGEIVNVEFHNCLINVRRNYIYEESDLTSLDDYKEILTITRAMLVTHKFVKSIKNSYDVIAYLMICMNSYCAKHFCEHDNGIYRSSIFHKHVSVPSTLPDDVFNFMTFWGSTSGQYVVGQTPHEVLELDTYTHITSPIRRLVDLLNMTTIQINMGLCVFGNDFDVFYKHWVGKLDYINTTMRSIRKIQTECSLLELCTNNPKIGDIQYTGYVFDRIDLNDGFYQYMAYIPELKMVSKVKSKVNIGNFEKTNFKIYLFLDEDRLKQKIRLYLVDK